MANKGRSEPGLFGRVTHYDEHGQKTGYSEPGIFGGYNTYDTKGNKVGHTEPGIFGGYNHYDTHGNKVGHSDPTLFGSYQHRDASGKVTGHSDPGMFGSYRHTDSEGCYVATCVYGSYDCPQVWTLRRFRDDTLGKSALGRAFIRTYYATSPTIVRWFGDTGWFKKMWRGVLDRMVGRLNAEGVEDTPYQDIGWR